MTREPAWVAIPAFALVMLLLGAAAYVVGGMMAA